MENLKFLPLLGITILMFLGCKEKPKEQKELSGISAENIQQVENIDEDEPIQIFSDQETSEDLYALLGDQNETVKKAKEKEDAQRDSLAKLMKTNREKDSLELLEKLREKINRESATKLKKAPPKKAPPKKEKDPFDDFGSGVIIEYNDPKSAEREKGISQRDSEKSLSSKEDEFGNTTTKTEYYKVSIQKSQYVEYQSQTRVAFLSMEDIKYEDFTIPSKTLLTGYTSLSKDRMIVKFDGIILKGKRRDIHKLSLYEMDGSEGIKVDLTSLKKKQRGTKTGGRILQGVLNTVTRNNDLESTLSNDAQTYGKEDIVGGFTLEENIPFLVKSEYY